MGGYSDIFMAVAIIAFVAIIGLLFGTGMKKQIRDSGVENYENDPKYKEGSKVQKVAIAAGIVGIVIILGINFLKIAPEDKQKEVFIEWNTKYSAAYKTTRQYFDKVSSMAQTKEAYELPDLGIAGMEKYSEELDTHKEKLSKLDIPLELSINRREKLKKAVEKQIEAIDELKNRINIYIDLFKKVKKHNVDNEDKILNSINESTVKMGIILADAEELIDDVNKSFNLDSNKVQSKIENAASTQTEKIPSAGPKTQQSSQSTPTGSLTAKDLYLGNVSVGDSTSSLKAAKGEPSKVVTENGEIHWKYNDIDVTIVNDTISTLITESSAVSTPKGIHENSLIGDVFTKYGNDYRYEVYNNIQLYEYPITSKDGAPCLLRFAVKNGENKVYYISMRKV
ncbi:hypothetical protein [uncultured Anaerovibrio sp.]|uniref:hypothetical protein n=1 Tax=uncultured Anaerovibrio sp. TaxID=361586 RepID=UPI0025D2DE0C|nr:hypothetical protein [uncultured Anaerovibrio sp.]